ncbi:hypothetical protein BW723_09710 [Polaribacter reichenbachii]|uniref:Polysaccharide biosynthesis protein C-terminal domain-containing protein n=1 Tax=Polaribacter reichenbachii TaxID=996801 RepID=A0A1B8U3B5_9FLAO|nr:oligosaccharide flippase family protein [Polaribacter reichenbachii]APZ46546.1 hypothetical protein BW723_09710 [Polaribacter reichenbachii]AUC17193.1 hypothetical protein BTO17_00160 [Polaribacter reichenbachii]OBY66370.1 hypothetical protein LPB301_06675 [Polaribacter reichenbachii]
MIKSKLGGFLKNKQGFLRNFSILTFASLFAVAVNLLVNIYLTRAVSTEIYGAYGVVLSVVNILLVMSSLGLRHIVIINIARNQTDSKFHFENAMILRVLGYFIIAILYFGYSLIINNYSLYFNLLILVYLLLLSIWDGIQNLAFGMERMEFTGYLNAGGYFLILMLLIIVPSKDITVETILIILILVQVIKNAFYYKICTKINLLTYVNNKTLIDKEYLIQLFRKSFPYYIMAFLTLFTSQVPILFLEKNSNLSEVAYLNAANKLMIPISLILSTALTALFPNLAKSYLKDKIKFMKNISNALIFILIFGSIGCLLINLFREEIVEIVFGDNYTNTGVILMTQAWFVLFNTIFGLIGLVLGATDNQKLLAKLSICYALVNTPILWYGSYFGAKYVSYAYLIGGIINMAYHYYFFLKVLPKKIDSKITLYFFATLFGGIFLSIIMPVNLNLVFRVLMALFLILILGVFIKKKFIKNRTYE